MEKQSFKNDSKFINTIFTRTILAKWYGITEEGLRKRMKRYNLAIKNRILTLDDVWLVLQKLGKPSLMPNEWLYFFEEYVPLNPT